MPEQQSKIKPVIVAIISIFIVAASFGGGVYVGYERRPAIEKVKGVLGQEAAKPAEVDFSLFWEVWGELEAKYVDHDFIDRKKLVEGAITGLVKALGDRKS